MARFSNNSTGWKIIGVVGILLFLAVAGVCIAAGVIAGQESIGFFEALGRVFGVAAKTGGEIIEEAGQSGTGVVEGVTEAVASII